MVDWNDPRGGAFALYFRPHCWEFDSLSTTAPGNLPCSHSKKLWLFPRLSSCFSQLDEDIQA